MDDLSGEQVAIARDEFTERAQNGQRALVESSIGTPNNRGVGDLTEEVGKMWAIAVELGGLFGRCAVWACLRGVR